MKGTRVLCLAALVCVWASPLGAAKDAKPRPAPVRTTVVDNSQRIDVNQVSMVVTNTGSFAYDKATGNSGLEFPKGTGKTAVFAAGLWVGGQVSGVTRLAVSEYSDEYGPGSAIGGTPHDPDDPLFHVYKLSRVYTSDAERDAALAQYEAGAEVYGAPDVEVQGDGTLNILGDQMTWAVYNDLDPANHTNRAGTTAPLGIEVQQTTFAFNRLGALGNTVFIRYKFINRGTNSLTNMFVSQWSDPDLGGFTDDLVACDPALGLGYVYNATNNDEQYGTAVPAVGYDFFVGPGPGGGMTSFNKYINGTDPNTFAKSYNYMRGLDADGNVVINPVTGQPTNFQVSGDPVTGSGWLDSNPADRRLMLSSGPFSMAPNDSQEVVAAIVIGQSSNRLRSISLMKFFDLSAQAAFDANFDLPPPPDPPLVTATPLDGGVRLTWDTSSEGYSQAPYNWEGYVVYQGASIAGPWTRVATYDRVNTITTVLDNDFNEEQGLILPTGKAFGTDAGVRYQIEVSSDAVRGGPLNNATTYYYSVNGYAVGLGEFPQVLESAFNPIAVVPQTPPAGVDLSTSTATAVTQGQTVPGPGATTDVVTVTVITPATTVDANWRVGFKPACATCTNMVWYLVRTMGTAVDTVVNNWPNFAADDNNPVVNGIQVRILSYPPGELARITYEDVGPNPAAIEGVNIGAHFFGGGGDYAAEQAGSSIAAHTPGPDIEVRFTGGPTGQYAYRYLRQSPGGATAYNAMGYVPVPFTVWDIDSNTQLNVGFLETEGAASHDSLWMPSTAGNGGRENLYIMSSPYSGDATPSGPYLSDPDYLNMLDGNIDLWYFIWPRRPSTTATIDAGDKIAFTTSIPAATNDFFTFSTTAAFRNNTALAQGELARVRAVPNPYFTRSVYELTQFNRVIKFTHLPERCTIRIFNLAGDLIRTIEKNDNTSQASWNLETSRGLPVGSGIYIFHVDAPGIGTHVGKMAVFMERERLNNF